jgi:LmbE family N-acetylglucosaminyl deacetylase
MIIIAPHPDDELIGCSKLLNTGQISKVIYLDNLNEGRKCEAVQLCEYFDIDSKFLSFKKILEFVTKNPSETFLVPSIQDHHPEHRMISTLPIKNKGIYSIDMNTEFISVLTTEEIHNKTKLLNYYYSSQKELWEKNDMYLIFEGTMLII